MSAVKAIALVLAAVGVCYLFVNGSRTGVRHTVIGLLFVFAAAAVSIGLAP